MPATVLIGFSGGYEFEPEIITENGRDGITLFKFNIIGNLPVLNSVFELGESISGNTIPDLPPGEFKIVNRSLEHIAGDAYNGIYRLSLSAEGGKSNESLEIISTSLSYQKEEVSGLVSIDDGDFQPTKYILEWLSPSGSVTSNSSSESSARVESRARDLIGKLQVQIIRNRPDRPGAIYSGPRIDVNKVIITGSNIESAGGLYRVSATATKGIVEEQ